MRENRYNLRLSKSEKDSLNMAAKQNGTSIIEYMKRRLFFNNPDISSDNTYYECPSLNEHNYLTARVLQNIYMLLLKMISEEKSDEETLEIKNLCRDHAEKNIAKWNYQKIKSEE